MLPITHLWGIAHEPRSKLIHVRSGQGVEHVHLHLVLAGRQGDQSGTVPPNDIPTQEVYSVNTYCNSGPSKDVRGVK